LNVAVFYVLQDLLSSVAEELAGRGCKSAAQLQKILAGSRQLRGEQLNHDVVLLRFSACQIDVDHLSLIVQILSEKFSCSEVAPFRVQDFLQQAGGDPFFVLAYILIELFKGENKAVQVWKEEKGDSLA